MARTNEGPWYRQSKGTWYITLPDGKKVSLKVRGEKNRAEAVREWHRLMASPKAKEATQKPAEPKAGATVKVIVDAFLSDAKARVKPTTFRNYDDLLTGFSEKYGTIQAEALTPAQALAYSNRDGWGQAHRFNLLGAIKAAFKWAEENGVLGRNPMKAMKRPPMPSRGSKAAISPDTHLRLLEAATPHFRLILTMLHETGARPSEVARLTAQDVDFASGVAVRQDHKTSHKTGKPRLIVLSPQALAIVKAQAEAHPEGPIFLNARGNPWTKDAIVLAMRRTTTKAGVKAIAYGYRHGYATDALASGVADATVAALLGHSSTTMLHRHYSHLTSRVNVLREAAGKVR